MQQAGHCSFDSPWQRVTQLEDGVKNFEILGPSGVQPSNVISTSMMMINFDYPRIQAEPVTSGTYVNNTCFNVSNSRRFPKNDPSF